MKAQAKLIKVDGSILPVTPKNGKDFSYEELTGFVGGYIEIVRTNTGKANSIMVINEEGKLEGLDVNIFATMLLMQAGGMKGDYIAGNCLLCLNNQVK